MWRAGRRLTAEGPVAGDPETRGPTGVCHAGWRRIPGAGTGGADTTVRHNRGGDEIVQCQRAQLPFSQQLVDMLPLDQKDIARRQ